ATNLFGGADPIGQTIQLSGATFQVEGLLTAKGSNGIQDQDDIVIVPLTTAQDLLVGQSGQLGQIIVEATSSSTVNAEQAEAQSPGSSEAIARLSASSRFLRGRRSPLHSASGSASASSSASIPQTERRRSDRSTPFATNRSSSMHAMTGPPDVTTLVDDELLP